MDSMSRGSPLVIYILILFSLPAWSKPNEDIYVSIAAGVLQPIRLAPAVTSVITKEYIEVSGARDLDDLLMSIPGLHVSRSATAYAPIYTMRGIYSEFNAQILMLVNGMPITHIYSGSRSLVWGGMPVHKINRIELIRGPGSAFYGADALGGVINIITHTAKTLDNNELGIQAGSFDSNEVWWSNRFEAQDLKVAWTIEMLKTEGHDEQIDSDTQTLFDTLFGSDASLAPGKVNLGREALDASVDANYKNWNLNLFYQRRRDVETGAGNAQALDPIGSMSASRLMLDLQHSTSFHDNWKLDARLNYFRVSDKHDFMLFPPNSLISFGGAPALFVDGVVGEPDYKEKHLRFDATLSIDNFRYHQLVARMGVENTKLYGLEEKKNFDSSGAPLSETIDVTLDQSLIFILPHQRENMHLVLQDEWIIKDDWYLTFGVRYDHYNDFGGTTNPRTALVWDAAYDTTFKLLYGRAFRAPSYAEQYLINNPVVIGNNNIKPETSDTYELVMDKNISHKTNIKFNLFHYKISDFIRTEKQTAPSNVSHSVNVGKREGYGAEVEILYHFSKALVVNANHSWQVLEDSITKSSLGFEPRTKSHLRVNWQISDKWNINTTANHVGKRARIPGDTRESLAHYTLTDIAIQYGKLVNDWSVALAIKNLFNEDAREPATSTIPNDLPLAGRSLFVELRLLY